MAAARSEHGDPAPDGPRDGVADRERALDASLERIVATLRRASAGIDTALAPELLESLDDDLGELQCALDTFLTALQQGAPGEPPPFHRIVAATLFHVLGGVSKPLVVRTAFADDARAPRTAGPALLAAIERALGLAIRAATPGDEVRVETVAGPTELGLHIAVVPTRPERSRKRIAGLAPSCASLVDVVEQLGGRATIAAGEQLAIAFELPVVPDPV
ncbi:MAG: hypothetical protein IPM29_32230 [Planctomycetes bacterium]|nr:hypothetical protein [Planctomycetota bacterium]